MLQRPGEWGFETTHCHSQFWHLQQTSKEFKIHTIYSEISEKIKPLQLLHRTTRAQDQATTNCRKNWQSSKQLKLDTILDAWQKRFIFPSQSDSLKFWKTVMANFCSDDFAVWEAPASLKLSIEVILCIEYIDIMSTSYAYVLLLRRARSPPQHAARDCREIHIWTIGNRILPNSKKLKSNNVFNTTYNSWVVLGGLDRIQVIL